MNSYEEWISISGRNPVIAVLVVDEVEDAVPLAESLLAGGIGAMELTLRTPAALDSLKLIRENVPDMTVGAGTVLTREQVNSVKAAGARFAVAPGLNRNVISEARDKSVLFAPGIATPSDIEAALELNCRVMKFFPAEPSGGLSYLKSMAAPYLHMGVRFIPLGGLDISNMRDWLSNPMVCSVGGSWIAPRDLIRNKEWDKIRARAEAAAEIASSIEKEIK